MSRFQWTVARSERLSCLSTQALSPKVNSSTFSSDRENPSLVTSFYTGVSRDRGKVSWLCLCSDDLTWPWEGLVTCPCSDMSWLFELCLIVYSLIIPLFPCFVYNLYDIGDSLTTWPQKPHVTSLSRDRLARATCRDWCVTLFIPDSCAEPSPLWATSF
jgi:hypothetical protein